ncbi:helix-turn-helix domain-containing protein [Gulosibacter sediminis]|uniref:helix-turn-helix domain-containing protein n=1 Tax=Gulosibacter sediminis TaxID=1729695 RepID=UPI001866DA95|nr:helix-turn-helix domain-containing protein [Gulosibacter sediminis]
MRSTIDDDNGRTYVPDENEERLLSRLSDELNSQARTGSKMRIISGDGDELELPARLFDIIRQVATTLSQGRGITVMPHDTVLTTQEAADFLGISRPTLVKHLAAGDIPFSLVGRHRRVRLADLLKFQAEDRAARRALLRRAAREGQEDGLFGIVYEPESE